ncbi:MAG: DsbA family protein [Myxococcota bacterium]
MKNLHRFSLYALALTILLSGVVACSSSSKTTTEEETARGAVADEVSEDEDAQPALADSDKIPIGNSPVLGPADAPVTIVEFADYQCPFCSKSHKTMEAIREQYGDGVRVVFKHYPLPFHKQAEAASRAAIAAGEQGKFWEMHDLLFRYQKVMRGKSDAEMKDWSAGFAREMGLDVEQFRQDFAAESTGQQIEDDLELAEKLTVKGTPHFFINGVRVSGAQPMPKFEAVIDAELEAAEEAGDDDNFYAMRVEENYAKPAPPKPRPSARKKVDVAYVPVDADDPMTGETDSPLVTVVAFSDFQCPFCAKAAPTLEQIEKNYGDEVRIVFKQLPLPFHKQAEMAAEIALAAHAQGKFWEMHDLLFEKQREMKGKSDAEMVQWSRELAAEIGADPDKLAQQVDQRANKREITEESKLAGRVGARGTPNFFINGHRLTGAQPYPKFETVIDEQLAIARKLKKDEQLEGEALYKAAVEHNKGSAPEPEQERAPSKPNPQVDTSELTIDDDQVENPKNYDVTVFAFADYQCPYCSRGHDNLHDAIDQVDATVRVVFKHYPLPFHKQAKDAAYAAMAAGEQGKFWEMSEALFAEQRRFDEDGFYIEKARKIGLDVDQFKRDLKNNKKAYEDQVEEDMAQGKKLGVRGTPAYFIDGERIVGAQPSQKFVDVIEKKARESDK